MKHDIKLARRTNDELAGRNRTPIVPEALEVANKIVVDVESRGGEAVRQYACELDGLAHDGRLWFDRVALETAWTRIDDKGRGVLSRTAERITAFAEAQRAALEDVVVEIPGGTAGHRVEPVERVGCYAPGGRYPLPSSVLMTVIPARVAGVPDVLVASPNPPDIVLAAAHVAHADGVLAAGGAHGIAALAFGLEQFPRRDMIVGPGNRFVTAAKYIVSDRVGIDMLAGPSELVVVAGADTDPVLVAADLLAQAEHDPDALPVLISIGLVPVADIERELERQLADLPTADIARQALVNGGAIVVADVAQAITVCNAIAPEHLQWSTGLTEAQAAKLSNFGALFLNVDSAVVLGDYGTGPNHVLPTGGTARFQSGLSPLSFLRTRTWMSIDDVEDASDLAQDARWFGVTEGLVGHARAAEMRIRSS